MVEERQRQTCAMFDMVLQQIVHNLQDDRHESKKAVKNVKKTLKKATVNKSSVKKSSVKKSIAVVKKPSATPKKSTTIAKKPSVLAKTPSSTASKTPMKKPSTKIGAAKKSSTSSKKQNVETSAEQTLDCLPDLSSETPSEESIEDVSVAESVTCPSMPSMLSHVNQSILDLIEIEVNAIDLHLLTIENFVFFSTFISLLVLQTEDTESDDNLKSIPLSSKAVEKRRRSDFALPSASNCTMRKKTMPVHSSVLAISNKPPNIVTPMSNNGPEIAKEICSTPVRTVNETNKIQKSVGELNKD